MTKHNTTTRDVAQAFGISIASVCRLAQQHDSPAIRVGGSWRWPSLDLVESWLRRRTSELRTGRMTDNV